MRLLLDTHIAIWAVSVPEKLPARWVAEIADPDNALAVSVVSLWEIAVKRPLKRGSDWDMSIEVSRAKTLFRMASFDLLSIEIDHLVALETLPLHHRDPFDRLLVATSYADTYRLVTHDRAIAAYGDHVIVI